MFAKRNKPTGLMIHLFLTQKGSIEVMEHKDSTKL